MFSHLPFFLFLNNIFLTALPYHANYKKEFSFSNKSTVAFIPFFLSIALDDVNFVREFFIILFLLLAVFFSLIVLTAQNPIFSALSLMGTYVFSGLLLICLDLEIFGIYFILIYAGAISVLILFVVMMINLRFKEKTELDNESNWNFWLKTFFSLAIFFTMLSFHFSIEHLASFFGQFMFGVAELKFLDNAVLIEDREFIVEVTNLFPMLFTNQYLFIVNLSLLILSIGMIGASFLVLSTKK